MKISILFFDVDGTLISKVHPRMGAELVAALRKLRQQGILLCIATGRHMQELRGLGLTEDFPFDAYITMNGNLCYCGRDTLLANPIHKADVLRCTEYVSKNQLPCLFLEEQQGYISRIDDAVRIAHESIHTPLPKIEDISRAVTHPVYQIIPYGTPEQISGLLAVMPNCVSTRWHPMAVDIVPVGSGKHLGVEAVLAHYKIAPENAMAFGDGENDIGMLGSVGHPVVMGNAEPLLWRYGEFVTKSVDENGVLHALSRYSPYLCPNCQNATALAAATFSESTP